MRHVRSLLVLPLAVMALAGITAVPSVAAPSRVVPADGKWAGIQPSVACNSAPAPDPSVTALPDRLVCPEANLATNDEVVAFSLANRRITRFNFDVQIQCLSTPDGTNPPMWQGTVMSYRATDFSYTGVNGTTAIPPSGLLRIAFPVEETVGYPEGTVRATFDFRGAKAKVSIYYKGRSVEPSDGTWVVCYSDQNLPSVVWASRLAR